MNQGKKILSEKSPTGSSRANTSCRSALFGPYRISLKKKVLKFRNRQFMCKIPDFWLLLQKVHSHVAAELGWLADVLGERPPHTQCSAYVDPRNGGDCDYRANHHLEHG